MRHQPRNALARKQIPQGKGDEITRPDRTRRSELLRLVNQIEPGSYLGDAFHFVGCHLAKGAGEPSEPSSSSSDKDEKRDR